MNISELTGKIFTNMGKKVITFSLLVGNEGWGGHIKCAFFLFLTDGTAVAEMLRVTGNSHNLSARGNNNNCGNSSFILER